MSKTMQPRDDSKKAKQAAAESAEPSDPAILSFIDFIKSEAEHERTDKCQPSSGMGHTVNAAGVTPLVPKSSVLTFSEFLGTYRKSGDVQSVEHQAGGGEEVSPAQAKVAVLETTVPGHEKQAGKGGGKKAKGIRWWFGRKN